MTSTKAAKKTVTTPAVTTLNVGKTAITTEFSKAGDGSVFDRGVRDHGSLVYWSAGEMCPCRANDTTEQADPNCSLCDGGGFVYLFPDPNDLPLKDFNCDCNTALEDTADARLTQAFISGRGVNVEIFEKPGEWSFGQGRLTTYSWHRPAFRDRFVEAEAVMPYRQVLPVPATKLLLVGNNVSKKLRYPAIALRRIFKLNTAKTAVTDLTSTVTISDGGGLDLTAAAVSPGDLVSVHYHMRPRWIVVENPYAVRDGRAHAKQGKKSLGVDQKLPMHFTVKLDFLL